MIFETKRQTSQTKQRKVSVTSTSPLKSAVYYIMAINNQIQEKKTKKQATEACLRVPKSFRQNSKLPNSYFLVPKTTIKICFSRGQIKWQLSLTPCLSKFSFICNQLVSLTANKAFEDKCLKKDTIYVNSKHVMSLIWCSYTYVKTFLSGKHFSENCFSVFFYRSRTQTNREPAASISRPIS